MELETSLAKSYDLSNLTFEERFRTASKWSKIQWRESGMEKSRFNTIINSANFWKVKLKEAFTENNVILATFHEEKDVFYNAFEIVDYLQDIYPKLEILSYNKFRNRRFLAIDFKDTAMKNFVLENFKNIFDSHVYFLSWASRSEEVTVRAHWYPRELGTKGIEQKLSCYVNIREIKREAKVHNTGKEYENGAVAFVGQLKEKVNLEMIPHILYVGSLEVLIVIAGRAPLCLTCNALGHRAYQCETIYCKACRANKLKKHVCAGETRSEPTYADILKASECREEEEEQSQYDSWINKVDHVSKEEYYEVNTAGIIEGVTAGQNTTKSLEGGNHGSGFARLRNKKKQKELKNENKESEIECENSIIEVAKLQDDQEVMEVSTQALKRKLEEQISKNKDQNKEQNEVKAIDNQQARRMINRGTTKNNLNIYENLQDEGGGGGGNIQELKPK